MIFRNSIRIGTEFYFQWQNPIWRHLGRIVQFENTRVVRNSWPYCNCLPWRFIRRKEDLIVKDWRWKKEVSSRFHELRVLVLETEVMKETSSRIREQNSVDKEFLEIVDNGSPTGSVLKETIAVSATIWISVQKWHSRICLQILCCSRGKEMRREPEVPEARVPVAECLDGPARITSKELAPIHWHPPECLF